MNIPLPKGYSLNHETVESRCCWCWETIDSASAHTVVSPVRPPYFQLRFHHQCWPQYFELCPAGLTGRGSLSRQKEWQREELEILRINCGLDTEVFAKELQTKAENLRDFMAGRVQSLPLHANRNASVLAERYRVFHGNEIDWSKGAAVFHLLKRLGWENRELAKAIGIGRDIVGFWVRGGVPQLNLLAW